jgi:glycosyltransferase involved in cell wall biosynthesis
MNKTNPTQPRFGIVIPVRMMPDELPGAIDSILSQEINGRRVNTDGANDVAVIVVVDDIDPKTRAVLDGYGDAIRWVEGDKRKQAGAVNKGLGLVSGEIIKWVNADDRLLPGALEAVDRAFHDQPAADFVYGDIVFLNAKGQFAGEHLEPAYSPFVLLYGHNLFADPACFWRRSLHDKIGPIAEDTRFSLDYEFWVRLVRHKVNVAQIRQRLAAFKVTGDNMSVVNHAAMRLEHFDAMTRHYPAWARLPRSLRNWLLARLLFVARVIKRLRSRLERGPSKSNSFVRLMADPTQVGHD